MNTKEPKTPEVFTVDWVQHDGPNAGVLQSQEFTDEKEAVNHVGSLTMYVNTDVVSHSPWVSAWTLNGRDSVYDYNPEDVKGVVDYAASIEYPLSHSDFRIIDGTVWVENVRSADWLRIAKLAIANSEKSTYRPRTRPGRPRR